MPSGTQPLPSPLSRKVGELLSDAINDRGFAQATVAERANMSASQLSRALNGKKVFTLDQLDALCEAVGVDLIALIADADAATQDRRATGATIRQFPGRNVGGSAEDDLAAVARTAETEPTDEQ